MTGLTKSAAHPLSDSFDKTIRSLNDNFGLDIRGPDTSLSPSKSRLRRQSEGDKLSCELHQHLRVHHFKGTLPEKLGEFYYQAKSLSAIEWVDKPLGDKDTLPSVSGPHGARTGSIQVQERDELRKCLQRILRPDEKEQHGQSRTSKRASDTSDGRPSRHTKSRLSGSSDQVWPVDSIPVRSQRSTAEVDDDNQNTLPSTRILGQRHLTKSFLNTSANTSKTSITSTVFSARRNNVEDTPQTTQEAEWNTENCRPPVPNCQELKDSFSDYGGASTPDTSDSYEDEACRDLGDFTPVHRMQNIWPAFPSPGLNQAPLAVVWEITRIATHCNVDLSTLDLTFDPGETSWLDQHHLWDKLSKHEQFVGKSLPAKSEGSAWRAALQSFEINSESVVLTAELIRSKSVAGSLFDIKLHPLSLRQGHRLERRFGADRFLELLIPDSTAPKATGNETENDVKWLCDRVHSFIGRTWEPFFVKTDKKKITSKDDLKVNPLAQAFKPNQVHFKRVFFFATDGNTFRPGEFPAIGEARNLSNRTKMSYRELLEWAINIRASAEQPIPKLFSRLALSVSRTKPTVLLSKSQIRHREQDLQSTPDQSGKTRVMNDGIGRMSRALAVAISDHLFARRDKREPLSHLPSAFQGRLGSAKGIWIVDVSDDGLDDEIWIETYPSQRKWKCAYDDEHHRVFEVREFSAKLKPAALNMQFIPLLEAQSRNANVLRKVIADHLKENLFLQLESLSAILDDPVQLRSWMHRHGMRSTQRTVHGHIPFVGSLPNADEDKVNLLLDAGFGPSNNNLLNDLMWKMGESKTEQLRQMKIQIPCSTWALITVDFTGTLKPGEVHFSFSDQFEDGTLNETMLEDMEILVARSPAHFPSDIQKVKVVSIRSLRRLKDVIVFPSLGERPLADLLSGGDYDGDRAWVCWDHTIVRQFQNAAPPPEYNFLQEGFYKKETTTFQDLLNKRMTLYNACREFRYSGISFNMQSSLLGRCTNYKERMCYHRDPPGSEEALLLSTLLSNLVDEAKDGITFTPDDWARFKRDRLKRFWFDEPEYTKNRLSSTARKKSHLHIIDFLRFDICEQTIIDSLTALSKALKQGQATERKWDSHLAGPHRAFEKRTTQSSTSKTVRDSLIKDLNTLSNDWTKSILEADNSSLESNFESMVKRLHEKWLNIKPPEEIHYEDLISLLNNDWFIDADKAGPLNADLSSMKDNWSDVYSNWQLLKASYTFARFCKNRYNFAWWMAGQQLCEIKTRVVYGHDPQTAAFRVCPDVYASLRPDKRSLQALEKRKAGYWGSESLLALQNVLEYDENGSLIDD